MNKLVLIPSAKLVPLELQNEFGQIPSAMIPLDSRPALHYISEYYEKRGYDFLIAVHENAGEVYRYCRNHMDILDKIVDVQKTESLGETILCALKSLQVKPDQLVINFADTFVGDDPAEGDFIGYKFQEDVYRWTTFELDDYKNIIQINEKCTKKNANHRKLNVFVGILGICDVSEFMIVLEQALDKPRGVEIDPFYTAVQAYYNGIDCSRKTFQEIENWWDFGHLDTYYETKKAISLNCRYFNHVRVDSNRGIIHKTSTDKKKLLNEIGWYLKLPKHLQYLAPRIFDYSLSFENPFIDLEFYGYPALNDMYLYGNYDIGVWNHIFQAIDNIVHDMAAYQLKPSRKADLHEAMSSMYEQKTAKRLESILEDDRFTSFCHDKLAINHFPVFSLCQVLEMLPKAIERLNLYELQHFSIIHGDLCLSNILYDHRNRIVRVIDPRGGFGKYDIYGDFRYDIAKLSHSIEGDYDFLVNGLFDLHRENGNVLLSVHLQERHHEIKKLFKTRLLERMAVDYNHIKLIESLLFLSMVPLHADRFRSQQAFIARGLSIFSAVARNINLS
ncbi:MAG: hypothetical protein C4522_21775 [Desulfobacteraceae bacterium]|nr:MAG: hypothetical protein C4522_21775 [Desulfobacteraceae bacterium]